MVALGIGTGITTGIATGIALAPVGISKQGFYFNPVVMGDSSLWHNNALQCIEMKSRNFRHNSATSDSDYSTGDISDVGWNLVLAG